MTAQSPISRGYPKICGVLARGGIAAMLLALAAWSGLSRSAAQDLATCENVTRVERPSAPALAICRGVATGTVGNQSYS
ncbi:MAG: hypothetical protein O3A21_04830, partial [Proteobacteria bacterium]|nr:hypothetical protein [Pseudomonadota bacterium]